MGNSADKTENLRKPRNYKHIVIDLENLLKDLHSKFDADCEKPTVLEIIYCTTFGNFLSVMDEQSRTMTSLTEVMAV